MCFAGSKSQKVGRWAALFSFFLQALFSQHYGQLFSIQTGLEIILKAVFSEPPESPPVIPYIEGWYIEIFHFMWIKKRKRIRVKTCLFLTAVFWHSNNHMWRFPYCTRDNYQLMCTQCRDVINILHRNLWRIQFNSGSMKKQCRNVSKIDNKIRSFSLRYLIDWISFPRFLVEIIFAWKRAPWKVNFLDIYNYWTITYYPLAT